MKIKKPNAELVWKQLEDLVVPRLRLSVTDRVVYAHLLRHSRLEGKLCLRFSILWLARAAHLTPNPVRWAVRRLIACGVLRLVERGKAGHLVEVRLPAEIPGVLIRPLPAHPLAQLSCTFEEQDFLQNRALRNAIHAREGGRCFYCRRPLTAQMRSLDHVVPQVQHGGNSFRNLVSCCIECNSLKRGHPAADFLRWLHRERRLTSAELTARLRSLDALVAGRLRPPLPPLGHPRNV